MNPASNCEPCTISAPEFRTMIITCRLCIAACITCILVMLYSFYLMHEMPMMGMQKTETEGKNESPTMTDQMREHCALMPEMAGCESFSTQNQEPSTQNAHASMTMADMESMLVGKSGDDLDRAFLEAMIPHHQGAIDMAKYLENSKHSELRQMGKEIIEAQQREITQMRAWQTEWGYVSGSTQTMDHASMGHSSLTE